MNAVLQSISFAWLLFINPEYTSRSPPARGWAFDHEGLRELTGQQDETGAIQSEGGREGEVSLLPEAESAVSAEGPDDVLLAQEFAEIDALLARSSKILSGAKVPPRRVLQDDDRLTVLYDRDWDEAARLSEWRDVLDRSRHFPVVLRAALALDAWNDIDVLERGAWVGHCSWGRSCARKAWPPTICRGCISAPRTRGNGGARAAAPIACLPGSTRHTKQPALGLRSTTVCFSPRAKWSVC